MSVSGLTGLLDGADEDPVALHEDGSTTTRGALRDRASTVETALRANGREGRAVGVLMPNVPATIAAWFGVWNAGGSFVPLNPRVPEAELDRIVETTGVEALVTLPEVEVAASLAGEVVDAGEYRIVLLHPAVPREVLPEQAIVQFTSGTTGKPKAVVLRHDTISDLLDSVIGSLRGDRQKDRARMPNLVPMSLALWAGIYQVLFAFRLGVPVVLMDRFEPGEFARLVERYEIRSSVLPPAALVMLMSDPGVRSLAPLRYVR
ncbi:MAG: long-chain acyl-CoA synthetase, partial [Actinomycetota bacterium]|nr:long-chain acyl-CoA synthetase [Actinomycetota bacterium]